MTNVFRSVHRGEVSYKGLIKYRIYLNAVISVSKIPSLVRH